MQAVPQCGSHW